MAEHRQDVAFCLYLQFLADEQLAQTDARAKASGMVMGIYGIWRSASPKVPPRSGQTGISTAKVGRCAARHSRPPRPELGPAPMNPNQLFEAAYQPMVDLFRASMRSCRPCASTT